MSVPPPRWTPLLACSLTLACGAPSVATSAGIEAATSTSTTDSTTSAEASPSDITEPFPPCDFPPALACEPDGGGPYWLTEGEEVVVLLGCKTGLGLTGEDFAIDPMPAGATYDPATATLRWTPGLDQGAVHELTITAISYGETGTVKIGVADRWQDPANVPVVDPAIYTEEYGLPVLHLNTSPDINSDAYTPATAVYRGHSYTVEAKHRGAASLGYPKKSFTVKFAKDDRFNEPAHSFADKRRLVLISTFDDNTYIRQRLAYELWNRLDPDHLQIQVYSGVVFLDGAYWGLYTFADHVDDDLMAAHGLSKAGNLYKARTHDANFGLLTAQEMQPKASPHQGLTKEEGLPEDGEPGAYDDLDELVTFVATAPANTFLAELDARIDRRDYEDWWIFVSLIMGDDSAGKNSYHYHDPAGGPWRFAPWDFNDSFGQTWQSARKGFTVPPADYTAYNRLFARLLAEPSIGAPLRARYGELLGGVYSLTEVLALYDSMIAEIGASARRDEGLWGQQYIDYGGWNWRNDFLTHADEVLYTRQWIADRWAFVDSVY